MNDQLHELPPEILEYIDCIMDDIIIFTPDVKTHKKSFEKFHVYVEKIGHASHNQQSPHF